MAKFFFRLLARDRDCWAGGIIGLVGAQMLAMDAEFSGWGFAAFLASNVLILSFAFITRVKGLIVMQVGFMATSLQGLHNYLGGTVLYIALGLVILAGVVLVVGGIQNRGGRGYTDSEHTVDILPPPRWK